MRWVSSFLAGSLVRQVRALIFTTMKYLLWLACLAQVSAFAPGGLQSGPDATGSSKVADAVLDVNSGHLWLTGSTRGQFWTNDEVDGADSCYVALVQLEGDNSLHFVYSLDLSAEQGVSESCTSIALDGNKMYLSGTMEKNGILEDLRHKGATIPTKVFGMLMELDVAPDEDEILGLVGGRVLQDEVVVVPTQLDNTVGDDFLYLVSLQSEIYEDGPGSATAQVPHADTFAISKWHKLGNVTYDKTRLQRTFGLDGFSLSYGTQGDETIASLAGVIKKDDVVVVAGSSLGGGLAYGGHGTSSGNMDGFITTFAPETGTLERSTRIMSVDQGDDYILSMCDIPTDPAHIYIVGATTGRLDTNVPPTTGALQGFLQKLEIQSLQPVWTVQITADNNDDRPPHVRGFSCAVTRDGDDIYLAGSVENDAVVPLSGTTASFGETDVFVGLFSTQDGTQQWIRQLGSTGNDSLATHGGGVLVDLEGNAIMVGHTDGSLHRRRQANDSMFDIFVATFVRSNGAYKIPHDHPEFSADPSATNPSATDKTDTPHATAAPTPAPHTQVTEPIPVKPQPSSNEESTRNMEVPSIVLVALSASVLVIACFAAQYKTHHEINTDRKLVLDYMRDFDVDDIDLKRSATGGWHCSYANELAYGINRNSRMPYTPTQFGSTLNDTLMSPLTDQISSRNSMFLGSSGYRDEPTDLLSARSRRRDEEEWGQDII